MAHPDASATTVTRNASQQQIRLIVDTNVGGAIFTMRGGANLTTELLCHQLHAVADAQDRQTTRPEGWVWLRSVNVVDGAWAAAQDDAGRVARKDLTQRRVKGNQL